MRIHFPASAALRSSSAAFPMPGGSKGLRRSLIVPLRYRSVSSAPMIPRFRMTLARTGEIPQTRPISVKFPPLRISNHFAMTFLPSILRPAPGDVRPPFHLVFASGDERPPVAMICKKACIMASGSSPSQEKEMPTSDISRTVGQFEMAYQHHIQAFPLPRFFPVAAAFVPPDFAAFFAEILRSS